MKWLKSLFKKESSDVYMSDLDNKIVDRLIKDIQTCPTITYRRIGFIVEYYMPATITPALRYDKYRDPTKLIHEIGGNISIVYEVGRNSGEPEPPAILVLTENELHKSGELGQKLVLETLYDKIDKLTETRINSYLK